MSKTYYPVARGFFQLVLEGVASGAGSIDEPLVVPIIPTAITYHGNSYREPDTFSVEFDATDFPIDPNRMRAGSVELYVYNETTGDADDRKVISRQTPTTETTMRELSGVGRAEASLELGKRVRDEFVNYEGEPQIAGLVDECRAEHTGSGRSVTLVGQDYTALLSSRQWPPLPGGRSRRLPTGQRLDQWVDSILHGGFKGLESFDPSNILRVVVRDIDPADLPKVDKASFTAGLGRGIAIEQDTTVWDVIYKTVVRCGYICFVKGLSVVITRPKTAGTTTLPSSHIKKFAWGSNILELNLNRKMGREKCPRIVVKSWDPKNRRLLTVSWPPGFSKLDTIVKQSDKATETTRRKSTDPKSLAAMKVKKPSALPKARVTHDEFQQVVLDGITDEATLLRAAQNLFTLRGRGERTIMFTTCDMEDLDGKSLLNLEPGDSIELNWSGYDVTIPESERYAYLVAKGLQGKVAEVLAEHWDAMVADTRPLRLKEFTFDYEVGSKFSIEMEVHDFAVVDGFRDAPKPSGIGSLLSGVRR